MIVLPCDKEFLLRLAWESGFHQVGAPAPHRILNRTMEAGPAPFSLLFMKRDGGGARFAFLRFVN